MRRETGRLTKTMARVLAILLLFAAVGGVALGISAAAGTADAAMAAKAAAAGAPVAPLKPPATGSIPIAFLLSDGAVVIDFTGPWEVFQDASVPGRADAPFRLYTVAETTRPIHASSGLTIVPDYSFENAPTPKVIVIPAQSTRSDAALAWIRKSAEGADLTMSVCTGALLLAKSGLLSGKPATTHHNGFLQLAIENPDIHVRRGARFVEAGKVATAGGLSSGIDLALRVVERYYGHQAAVDTAYEMEYQGEGWKNPDSNQVYAARPASTDAHPLCPVCEMDVDPAADGVLKSTYKGRAYYFCSPEHKALFDKSPETYLAAGGAP
jgi:putative intracellular protease/amidase/YHS domain-containing protein